MWRRVVKQKFTAVSVNLHQNSQHYVTLVYGGALIIDVKRR